MLTPTGPNLWCATHSLTMPGGVHFSVRMTVARLSDGGLLLHSPVSIDDALAAELDELGPVVSLVAPNKLHHLYLTAAQERYPEATTWGAPGLAEKVPALRIDHTLHAQPAPWASDLEPLLIDGIPWMNETVFLHRASRSLIVTDLFFHFHSVPNWQSRLLFTLLGVLGRAKQSPLVRMQTRDKGAAAASARQVLAWDFDRVIMAHGDVLEDDAKSRMVEILGPMIRRGGLALAAA